MLLLIDKLHQLDKSKLREDESGRAVKRILWALDGISGRSVSPLTCCICPQSLSGVHKHM